MNATPTLNQPDSFPASKAEVRLRGPAGELEVITDTPDAESARPAVAVICHPHPLHGGSFHNKVVTILERSLRELGLATVRFTYRGVGDSEGQFDDGFGETEDLLTVVEWVRRNRPDDELWLAGFSFGSYVALRAAQNLKLKQLISVAPPVDKYEFAEMDRPDCNWMVIQGDEDDVVSADAVVEWANNQQPPPDLIVMNQAGHFFHRRLMDLRGLVKNAVRDQLPAAGR
jgi:alpha/beta superfamily hydrolase